MAATGISGSAAAGSSEYGHAAPTAFWALTLGSIGVVYGDIGTSPLYALKESLAAATSHAGAGSLTREVVIGVVSLILWALIIIVTLKYVALVLRADNNGEGGTLSLVTLAQRALGHSTGATISSVWSARRCSTAMPSSRPRSRCSPLWRASSW
jgi:KUP system potassium uptake protein